jgi:hypothetical protein
MNVKNFIAAAVVFAAAGSAFAANPADAAAAPAGASAAVLAANLNLPSITVTGNSAGASRSRAEIRAEAVEFVKNYKTALSVQLEQYNN